MKRFSLLISALMLLMPAQVSALPAAALTPRRMVLARRACYLESVKHWDSGVTLDMVQASYAYADCLEAVVVQGLESWYELDLLEGVPPKVYLDRMLDQADTLAHVIETAPKTCAPTCGSMYQVNAASHRGDLLEHVLRRMAERLLLDSEDGAMIDDPRWDQCWKEPERCESKWLEGG